jgi:hypothetical protein
VQAGKSTVHTSSLITERLSRQTLEVIAGLNDEARKAVTDAPKLSAEVRETLAKGLQLTFQLRDTEAKLKEEAALLKETTEEQARIRVNLEKIPNTAEIFKRYLTKLDDLETTLEKSQKLIKMLDGEAKKQRTTLTQFLKTAKAE